MNGRFKEPSTWAGVGALLLALNEVFDINEAAQVGTDIVTAAGAGAPVPIIIGAGITSLLGIFLREKK